MANGFQKKKSKRMKSRTRFKIEKKVREHNRKAKKGKLKKKINKRSKKFQSEVPNKCPFKEDVLNEAVRQKEQREQERVAAKEKRKQEREEVLNEKRGLSDLVQDAQERETQYNEQNDFVKSSLKDFKSSKSIETSLKTFYKEFKKVIDESDVILQVLDARDPLGCRCPQVETAVSEAGSNKKLVLLLNKIDLVPKSIVESWLSYLRNEFPTIAFKASTQRQAKNLSRSKLSVAEANKNVIKSSVCIGSDLLMKLLGNYCRSKDIQSSITVGVVGFPNTGKSSVINSLKRSKACNVGSTPGVTRQSQLIQLDKHIKLLDSPGIVMAKDDSDSIILRNCVKVELLEDPFSPVDSILKRADKKQMMLHYSLPDYGNTDEFLSSLAKRFGLMKKGGHLDQRKAAVTVLNHWNSGRITYYTHPPEKHTLPSHLDSRILDKMSAEFDIDSLLNQENHLLSNLKTTSGEDIVLPTSSLTESRTNFNPSILPDDNCQMDTDTKGSIKLNKSPKVSKKLLAEKSLKQQSKISLSIDGNSQINSMKKKEFKKLKKQRKRADKLSEELSGAMESALRTTDEDYDFDQDFKMS